MLRAAGPIPPLRFSPLQMAAMGVWIMVTRERKWRESFDSVRAARAEEARCGEILSLLLPPTLVDMLRGANASGDERFAERFAEASVLFVESEQCIPV